MRRARVRKRTGIRAPTEIEFGNISLDDAARHQGTRCPWGPRPCGAFASRELFLEGQHLFDLVRFGKTPDPTAGTAYAGGGVYGSQLCLPLPDVEKQNNPNFP